MLPFVTRVRLGWLHSSTRTKLIISILLLSTLPFLAAQAFLYRYYSATVARRYISSQAVSVEQTAKLYGATLDSFRDVLINILLDDSVVGLATTIHETDDYATRILAVSDLRRQLFTYCLGRPAIYAISFLPVDGREAVVAESLLNPWWQGNLWEGYADVQYRLLTASTRRPGFHFSRVYPIQNEVRESRVFHVAVRLVSHHNLQQIGTLVLTVDEEIVRHLVLGEGEMNSRDGLTLLMDREGWIISSGKPELIGLNAESPSALDGLVAGENFPALLADLNAQQERLSQPDNGCAVLDYPGATVLAGRISGTGWVLLDLLADSYLYRDVASIRLLYLATTALTLILIAGFAVAVSNRLARSAGTIVEAMEGAAAGGLESRTPPLLLPGDDPAHPNNRDEMIRIAHTFNGLMEQIYLLTHNLRLEKDRTAEALQKEKDAEITALTAQINPHFLYNTLDAINWSLLEHGEYEISRMITSLSAILRGSIDTKTRLITVEEELEWLRRYVYLRKCANDSFICYTRADPAIAGARIYKLMVQPIVENAISHGFAGYMEGGVLEIGFHAQGEDRLEVMVRDNGQGMDPEMLAELTAGRTAAQSAGGLGFANVLSRLRLYYGESASVQVVSSREAGTEIRISLPRL